MWPKTTSKMPTPLAMSIQAIRSAPFLYSALVGIDVMVPPEVYSLPQCSSNALIISRGSDLINENNRLKEVMAD